MEEEEVEMGSELVSRCTVGSGGVFSERVERKRARGAHGNN